MNIQQAIAQLVAGTNLTEQEMVEVMNQVMTGEATPIQVGAFLTALRIQGETVEEVTGAARVMREKASHVDAGEGCVLDTCGTGGDGKNTFNISTTVAFVVAAAGITVAKHGNRAVSSGSGSADVLGALGVKIDVPKETVERCLREVGLGFLFAPALHGAMKYAAAPRREVGIRTIFNLLGPLTNPANASHQLLGIYDGALIETVAQVLGNLGSRRAMVVHGDEGLDEISLCGPTSVADWRDGAVHRYTLDPEEFGFEQCPADRLTAADPAECAAIVTAVLKGEPGPARDVVLLNSGAALCVSERVATIADGIDLARERLDSGAALETLQHLVEVTNEA
ncbi:MAG: anthranilate phosphoribosyltransferase [Deltaproteobacteria bacterium]|nr:anthranilate phosphoribosyltransferase [Deltaproteobacteria bacterium]